MFEISYPKDNYYHSNKKEADILKKIFVLEKLENQTIVTEYAQKNDDISSGKIINIEDFANSVNQAYQNPNDNITTGSQILDERILIQTNSTLVWKYTPSETQNIYYKHGSSGYTGKFKWPTLLFKLKNNKLSVAVLRSAHKRPTATTRLYHAPLPNISESGSICLGTVVLPKNRNIDDISKAYLDSTKTHFSRKPYFSKKKNESTQAKFAAWLKSKANEPVKMSELTYMVSVQDFLKK